MLTKEQLNEFAACAGFGGNQRNTYRVKLELFAKMVEAAVMDQAREEMSDVVVGILHPEFGLAWREPDGEFWIAAKPLVDRINELETSNRKEQ